MSRSQLKRVECKIQHSCWAAHIRDSLHIPESSSLCALAGIFVKKWLLNTKMHSVLSNIVKLFTQQISLVKLKQVWSKEDAFRNWWWWALLSGVRILFPQQNSNTFQAFSRYVFKLHFETKNNTNKLKKTVSIHKLCQGKWSSCSN